ncbi:hypothetical protein MHBO_003531, partial [Bonamia ostreae]
MTSTLEQRRKVESSVIGAMIKNYSMMQSGCESLSEDHISDRDLRNIFVAIKNCIYNTKEKFINASRVIQVLGNSRISPAFVESISESASILGFRGDIDTIIQYHKNEQLNDILDSGKKLLGATNNTSETTGYIINALVEADSCSKGVSMVSMKDMLYSNDSDILNKIKETKKDPGIYTRKTISTG